MDEDLAAAVADVGRELVGESDFGAALERVTALALEHFDGCEHAGITLVEGRRVKTVAESDEVARAVDRVQYETNEGPCLDAIRERGIVRSDDVSADPRWPTFGPRARAEVGVTSMLSLPLHVRNQERIGALNLSAGKRGAFRDGGQARLLGAVFAAHASIGLTAALTADQLKQALASRDVIGQAKGILMERHRLSADEAFAELRRVSVNHNRKLREVAAELVATGLLPGA